jgi:hypothetical protein
MAMSVEQKDKNRNNPQKPTQTQFEARVLEWRRTADLEFTALSRPQTNSQTAQLGFHGSGDCTTHH